MTTEAAVVFHLRATSKCGTTSAARTATGRRWHRNPRVAGGCGYHGKLKILAVGKGGSFGQPSFSRWWFRIFVIITPTLGG